MFLQTEDDFLSSSSSSSSDSDSGELRAKIEKFVELTVPRYRDDHFKIMFRVNRTLCDNITAVLWNKFNNPQKGGWSKVTPVKATLVLLWYLGNSETFRQISDRFGITKSCAHNIIRIATHCLVEKSNEYIRWPTDSEKRVIAHKFFQKQHIPNIIGAIDGSHIRINKPMNHYEDFINRKGYHSILLQGIVNNKKQFINIYVGEPGSLHDARLLRKSAIYKRANDPNFFLNYYLLGDSAYPSLNWVVPPFRDNGHLTPQQTDFNFRHSSTRMVVENTFGLLKGKFRRLFHFENRDIHLIAHCVVAACVLLNMCLENNDEEFCEQDDGLYNNDDQDEAIDNNEGREHIFNIMYGNVERI